MNNRVNAVIMVLLMVLSVVASGLGTIPENQNDLDENNSLATQSGGVPCAGDYNLDTNSSHNDSGRGGDVNFSEITGNNVSHFGIVGSNDVLDDYCVVLNPGESIILSSMCASNATDCNNSSIGVKMWSGVFTAWNGSVSWVNLTSSITTLPTYTNNLTTNDTFAFGFTSGDSMFYSYNIWKIGGNSTGGNGSGNNSGGNNTGPMEWLSAWAGGYNFTSNSTIGVNWSAGDLVTSITYNVTLDVYAHNSTTNTTYVIWDDYTVFNATSNATWGAMQIPSGTLPTGCYYASVSLYDNSDGMHFDNDGFDLDVGMDCSNTGGNNTGGNNTGNASGAFVNAWPTNGTGNLSDYEMSSTDANITIGAFNLTNGSHYKLDWQITDLVTGILVGDGGVSWTATNVERVEWYDATNLGQGCYYFEVSLYDNPSPWAFVEYEDWPFTIDMTFAECNNTGGNNTGSMVTIDWINTTASSGGGDAEISVEHSGNWTAYWGITNTNSAPTFPLWNYSSGWWDASASGGLGTTTGSGDLTWLFQDMDQWGALAPPSCNVLMVALFDGNPGTASAQSTPATGYPVSIDFQTFELGNITAVDCNWDSSWGGNNNGGNNSGGNNNTSQIYAPNYHISLQEDHQATFVLNATHSQNQALTYTAQSQPNNGTLSLQSNGTATYTPDANYWGMDYFSYVASDGTNYSSAMVWLNVSCVVDVPAIPGDCDNNSGGNNTGGNNTGNTTNDCIDNNTATGYHTELSIWTDKTVYNLGETTVGTFYVNCTVVGEDYQLRYWLDAGAMYDSGWWNWTATQNFSTMTMTWNLPEQNGGYHLHGELELNGIWLANVESDAFVVLDNNTGGNNTGGNNTGDTAWGNGTARFIYIKPLAQNADEHTPFDLTFPAPPMADNSPYLSNMICSKTNGHSADVWETYVPMPFNNITSWKVENTYGLVMGMFEMNNAQTAGISTMQNPTVIFEQDLSFNGHAPSTVVDQATFNCPMANNTAPQISSVVIAPSTPLASDVLTCSYSYTDAENDPDVSSVTWMINGVPTTTSGPTLSSGFATGDTVICAVFAYDGMDYGNVETTSVLITSNSTGSGGSSGSGLPAIGAVGTLAAIGAGFFAILRREDDE